MKDEALRQALEALERGETELRWKAITAIKEALEQPEHSCIACEGNPKGKNNPCNVCGLAQPEPEPVAWMDEFGNVFPLGAQRGPKHSNEPMKPLYTTPPQRTWVGLTDEEISELIRATHNTGSFVRAIEAKLKEKNDVS